MTMRMRMGAVLLIGLVGCAGSAKRAPIAKSGDCPDGEICADQAPAKPGIATATECDTPDCNGWRGGTENVAAPCEQEPCRDGNAAVSATPCDTFNCGEKAAEPPCDYPPCD